MSPRDRVIVLGAGLQGLCVSFELARRGFDVKLIDRDTEVFNRASLRNEGKIHLGLVYALDPTLRTAQLMLDGALSFHSLLSRWTSKEVESIPLSTPFTYMVPDDSLCSVEHLSEFYQKVEDYYQSQRRQPGVDYLGLNPERLAWPLTGNDLRKFVSADRIVAGFGTVEASIDLVACAQILRRTVAKTPNIQFFPGREILKVERSTHGFSVEGVRHDGKPWSMDCGQVVNALWDGRLAVDESIGLAAPAPWVHRLKYRLLVELPPRLRTMPSMTFVLGAYGDLVTYPGQLAYISWYPECMKGWSTELSPPGDWAAACTGRIGAEEKRSIASRVLRAVDAYVPGAVESRVAAVDAGVIFAWGKNDITNRDSELHQRHMIGPASFDGYHTINTGKLTTAPMFAVEVANRATGATGAVD